MKQPTMRKAVVDKILLFLVLFLAFASIFFMVIDYYVILKVKDNSDTLTNYAVRMKALGKEESDIITKLNEFGFFSEIKDIDLNCIEQENGKYIVVFSSSTTVNNNRFFSSSDEIFSRAASFNEVNSSDINCTLSLSPKE